MSYGKYYSMSCEETKDTVMNMLVMGGMYKIASGQKDGEGLSKCCLVGFAKNFAVFEHKNGSKETFTYQELWAQLLSGEFKRL